MNHHCRISQALYRIHAHSSVGARPSSAAPTPNYNPVAITFVGYLKAIGKHESSSVGTRPSSAAPTQNHISVAQTLTRRKDVPCDSVSRYLVGAAEDGRAPTEEGACEGDGLWCGKKRTRSDRRALTEFSRFLLSPISLYLIDTQH